MIIKLTTVNRTYNEATDEVIKEFVDIPFSLDLSAYSDYRFEQYFKDQLNCSLIEYGERIAKIKGIEQAKANYISVLKLLYCYLESDKAPTFIDFMKLFDIEVASKLLEKVIHIIELSKVDSVKN